MVSAHFGNIRNLLINKLSEAKFDIYVAVAWITDSRYEQIFLELLRNGVSVNIILNDDDINRNSTIDWDNLVENNALIFWDDHHHKFCVIDRKIVISGSFNWTNAATKRGSRENIVVIEDERDLIDQYSSEFYKLKNAARLQHKMPQTVIEEKIVPTVEERPVIVIQEIEKRPGPYKRNGKFYCGICHNRMRPTKTPLHMAGFGYHDCKKCNIYVDKEGKIV